MVELIGVVVEEAGETRLNRCSFAVRAGEIVGLAGGSGSGKSTALQVAAGLIAPTRGRLVLDGRDVTRKPGRLRSACGLAERNPPGPDDLTIDAWMALWAGLDGVGRRGRADDERGSPTRDKAIREALERFDPGPSSQLVGRLSTGARARLSLARLWARKSKVVLLDAPAAALDGDGLRRLTGAVRAASEAGRTVIIADAAPHLLSQICERVVLLAQGQATGESARGDANFAQQIAAAQGWSA